MLGNLLFSLGNFMDMTPPFSSVERKTASVRQTPRRIDGLIDSADTRVTAVIPRIIALAERNRTTINEIAAAALEAGTTHLEESTIGDLWDT